ncbi:abhydrolase domain containing Hydr1 isoform X2 [Lycorma delicatula]|uniref:abhydrolase domain containing Hydr1 isoform X2 n=1 Tax=Lycorma delicatula TaxID=130591 RepID=UPI003F51279D
MCAGMMEWFISSVGLVSSIPRWYIWSVFVVGFITYYLCEVVKKPILTCSDGKFKNFLLGNVPLINERFWPTIWCFESRAQTLLASLIRSLFLPQIKYKREVLALKDEGQVALDWLDPTFNCSAETPVIVILPGLTGTSQAEYVKGLALAVNRVGQRVVIFNNRGIGGIELKTQRTYCAANTDDLQEVLEHIKAKYPDAPVGGVGISMGGLILGNYMACRGKEAGDYLAAGMLVSVPWNVFKGTESIERPGINILLNNHLASCLTSVVHSLREVLKGGPWVLEEVMKSRTIREFDSRFTAKQFGYKDVDDYYKHATLHNKLHKIHVPTLCISAGDDPFQPFDAIPIEDANTVEKLAILITSHGGHIGFMEGLLPFNKDQYMFRLCEQFFRSMFNSSAYKQFTCKEGGSDNIL